MKSASILLPNQIFEKHEMLIKSRLIYLFEHPKFFTEFKYHKQKLVFHRASFKNYYDFLKDTGFKVHYLEFDQDIFTRLAKENIKQLHIIDPVDHNLEIEFNTYAKKYNIELIYYDTPLFINTRDEIKKEFDPNDDHYFMTSFYIKQRKRLKILIENGKPLGGKWSFDPENREKIPEDLDIPKIWKPKRNNYVKEAIEYVEKNFKDNYGILDDFFYPTNFKDAQKWLEDFLQNRLKNFGTYEDAIHSNNQILFHSVLSPLLNIGLLNPLEVVNKTLKHAKKNDIPLNSLEGFIRQIIGWREYIRAMYKINGEVQRKSNFFNHKNKLPNSFWSGETGIEILDVLIKHLQKTAYLHHIERLMIFGNFMLLCEIEPNEVYKWFMENFIDAYDWVMVPNVFGMSQFSAGEIMVTKPYISGSNYLLKMSNFKKGPWSKIWDSLYWNFIYKHQKKISQTPRSKIMISYLKRIDAQKLKQYLNAAENFLVKFKKEKY